MIREVPCIHMLLSTQQSGILVGTDKIFLFLEDSDKTSVGNKEYLFSLQIILSEIYISLLFQTVVHYNTLNYIKGILIQPLKFLMF